MAELKHITGLREADALLRQLHQRVETRVLQAATMAGARVIAKEVKNSAPVGAGEQSPASKQYGRLAKNIKVAPLRSAKARGRRGARIDTGNAFWALFLEFGTRFLAARPFFRPAVDRSERAAVDKLRLTMVVGIEREAKKLSRIR